MAKKAYVELSPGGLIIETDDPSRWPEGRAMGKTEGERAHRAYARAQLLELVKPGDTIYTVLRHVSSSGMFRRIDLYVMRDNEPRFLSGYAATAMGYTRKREKEGIEISGCGMDMGFELVYNLGRTLWPEGTDKPHGTRNGEPDSDGGYALKHRWL